MNSVQSLFSLKRDGRYPCQMNEEISEDGCGTNQYELRISAQDDLAVAFCWLRADSANLVIDTNKANQAKEQAMAELEPHHRAR